MRCLAVDLRSTGSLPALLIAILCAPNPGTAADWPQWRGRNQNGIVQDFRPPAKWPKQLEQVWQVEVGAGHSTPIVSGGNVFVLTRVGDNEVVQCLNLENGESIWRDQYASSPELSPAVGKFVTSPRATPAAGDGRVYTLGAGGVLSAYHAAKGMVLWRNSFEQFKPPFAEFGSAASPMPLQNLCVAMVGGKDQGLLAAFDGASGKVKWHLDLEGPGYASPVLLTIGGQDQIVTQSQSHAIGVSPNGKLLWKIPFETQYRQNIVTAVAHGDSVIFSGFHEPLVAWNVSGEKPQLKWDNEDHPMYMSSPVLKDNLLFGMSERQAGHIFCVDARTGETLWTSPGRRGENVSVQIAGDLLVLLNEAGTLTFAKANPDKYEVVVEYKLAEDGTYAHPVLVDDYILIKDQQHLTVYRLPR